MASRKRRADARSTLDLHGGKAGVAEIWRPLDSMLRAAWVNAELPATTCGKAGINYRHSRMKIFRALLGCVLAGSPVASRAAAQVWRSDAAGVGTTARVLMVGTRPEDE